jgi:hypothetical protein
MSGEEDAVDVPAPSRLNPAPPGSALAHDLRFTVGAELARDLGTVSIQMSRVALSRARRIATPIAPAASVHTSVRFPQLNPPSPTTSYSLMTHKNKELSCSTSADFPKPTLYAKQ